ncbi:MAG: hypothetical protein IPI12_15825 [Ignavibacteriales bacterium]|nr:hypothetical protein [Ignavibacteriales bacterium]
MVKTTNGGRDWQVVNGNLPPLISKAIFFDELNILIFGYNAPMEGYRSTDGGVTWVSIPIPQRFDYMTDVQFLDSNLGYAIVEDRQTAGNPKRLIKTTDGGLNWVIMDYSFGQMYYLHFVNPLRGWVYYDKLYQTTDGGVSFSLMQKPVNMQHIVSADILHDTLMVIGGFRIYYDSPNYSYKSPQVAFSSNSGQTWNYKDLPAWTNGSIHDITFIDPENVVGVCSEGIGVVYTTNAGTSWGFGEGRISEFGISSIEIKDGSVYAAGDNGTFFSTVTSLSQPWKVVSDYSSADIRNAYFRDPGFVILGTDSKKILISSDKGNTWMSKILYGGVPYAVAMGPDSVIYAATNRAFFRSTDMGINFDSIAASPLLCLWGLMCFLTTIYGLPLHLAFIT